MSDDLLTGNGIQLEFNDNRNVVALSENQRKYRAHNTNKRKLICYKLDCSSSENLKRCDYGLVVPTQATVYFIELKGIDRDRAALQILCTIKELKEQLSDLRIINGRIVLSRVKYPNIERSNTKILKRKLLEYNGSLKQGCNLIEEDI